MPPTCIATDGLTLKERNLRHAEATDILPMLEAELAWKQSLRARTVADLTPLSIGTMDSQRVKLAGTWIKQNVRLNLDETGPGGEPKGRSCRVGARRSEEPRDGTTPV